MKNERRRIERRNKIGSRHIRGNFSLAIRHSLFLFLLALLAAVLPAGASSQSSNRWLLVFDVSSPMRNRTKGTEEILQDLLNTGMHGQIRPGDTIGIWTFSDKLHAGEAPLQVWSPEASQGISRHTLQYLDNLRYAKSANMDAVLTNVFGVVDASDFITVILFSDGSEPVKGTPFDDQINAVYKENYRKQRKADMPIVTVLQANHGNFTTNTVNFGPWPVDIPSVPLPPAPKPATPRAAPPKPAPAPPAPPPLIYDGRKDAATPSTPPPTTENRPSTMAAPVGNSSAPAPAVTAEQTATAPKVETPASLPTTSASTEPPEPSAAPPVAVSESSESESKPAPTPAPVTGAENRSEPLSSPSETASKAPTAPPVAEAAVPVPQANLFSARNIAIFSVAFTVIVVGLLLMSARRSRAAHASLITRSLEREKR